MSLLSIGQRAMLASSVALDVTGHNIANATVAGYSRQRAELATATGQFSGAGFIGRGVDVATVTRAHDAFLTREAMLGGSLAAMDAARSDQLDRLERLFAGGEAGLGHAANAFFNALTDVASRPADLPARQVVLARAEDLASRLRAADAGLDALQAGVNQALAAQVAEVNSLAAAVAQVNGKIAALGVTGHAPNDLLDERDRLLQRLSERVQVSTVAADDGSLSVFIAGGQRLVLGGRAEPLALQPDAADPERSVIAIADGAASRVLPPALFVGGSLAGLLRFQHDDLVAARARIEQFGGAIAGAVNDRQALGLDLLGGAGAPIFSADGRQVLLADPRGLAAASPVAATVGAGNAGSAAVAALRVVGPAIDASLTAGFTFTDADSDGLVDSYAWTLSDGSSGSAAWSGGATLALNGFELTLAGAPSAGDTIAVGPTAFPSANNGNALAMLALRDTGVVGGQTPTDAWATALAEIGVRVQGAHTARDISRGAADAALAARDGFSGVNLDEEAARLIQYQQSYQAAAKILQVAQTVFDALLDAARG